MPFRRFAVTRWEPALSSAMQGGSTVIASAPGSLMLLGEHAVLHGHRALVCAINRRITIQLTPNTDSALRIDSSLGTYHSSIEELADHPSFRFVVQTIRQYRDDLPSGFDLKIDSGFSADIGFGSSAAVTVAMHAVLMKWINGINPSHEALFAQALETVHTVQGRGSGADLAASIFGGIVGYSTAPEFLPVPLSLPLTAVFCGYKTPTAEVIEKVLEFRQADRQKYDRIYAEIDSAVLDAVTRLQKKDFPAFAGILNRNQDLMDAMGVNTPELQEIVSTLQHDPGISGAKISGSGLGDCAVGIGHAELNGLTYPVYHLKITPTGYRNHE